MKTYKLWIEIEEYDSEIEEYRQASQPVEFGSGFATLEIAVKVMDKILEQQLQS